MFPCSLSSLNINLQQTNRTQHWLSQKVLFTEHQFSRFISDENKIINCTFLLLGDWNHKLKSGWLSIWYSIFHGQALLEDSLQIPEGHWPPRSLTAVQQHHSHRKKKKNKNLCRIYTLSALLQWWTRGHLLTWDLTGSKSSERKRNTLKAQDSGFSWVYKTTGSGSFPRTITQIWNVKQEWWNPFSEVLTICEEK